MRITDVRAVQPASAGSPPDWRTSLGQILVTVETDDGLVGHGVGGGGAAGIHVIHAVLREVLVGREPEPIEQRWQEMYRATLPFGRKGLAIMALSGVDLALWDLRGRRASQPIVRLLGGKADRDIPVYVTTWGAVTPEQAARYRGFKLHVEGSAKPQDVADAVARARQTVGPDRPIMLDAWMKWTVEQTLAVAERVQDFHVAWIEEPLAPDDLAGYEVLRDRCPVPIAGGEHEFTARGFEELIDRRLHQVLQPDVCWCGGLTELIQIYRRAQGAGLRVCPHRGAEVWALHAIAALDEEPLAESGRPWLSWVEGQPALVDGCIRVPEGAGFGVRFSLGK